MEIDHLLTIVMMAKNPGYQTEVAVSWQVNVIAKPSNGSNQ
jgi:hypothetical protein